MDLGSIIAWIVIGAIAGWLASMVMKTNAQQGFIMDVIVGIVGAFIGGFVLSILPGVTPVQGGFNLGSLLTAFIGAVILLGILRMFSRGSRSALP